ncbi:DNA replication complex GINS protein PSF2 [Gilbertella persicaria]|uniref:DNA replication complex GINS protein PSF2 n=1 Tax=Gilbertella persicaria TaxID=101096 RepID=UPI002220C0A8|nr:DNA replication complex GINS protein PSF2 [Gilbertella persicaria]KAI8090161.1 DNA replication complex GINS protein PSF2 [Gilbertella persicaria]
MAIPRTHQASFTPGEIEFIAGSELISIIPKIKIPRLHFIQGSFGPFQPPLAVKVPVWLALIMKKNSKCSILCPEWLNIEYLKKRHEEEEKEEEFSKLPFHYMELSQMLLEAAEDDIPDSEQIRKILKDLRETRQAKSRAGLSVLDDKWLGMNNLSLMEINEIRPFFSRAFNEIRKLNVTDKKEEEYGQGSTADNTFSRSYTT